jgi:hypothetical protein
MWLALWAWLTRPSKASERGFFVFWNGRGWSKLDGLETLRGFLAVPGFDWEETPQLLKAAGIATQLIASSRIASAVRTVMKVKTAAEGGLTEKECLELFSAFEWYCDHVKKNGSLFQMSEDSDSSKSTTQRSSPIEKHYSDCGSTVKGQLPDPPISLQEAIGG